MNNPLLIRYKTALLSSLKKQCIKWIFWDGSFFAAVQYIGILSETECRGLNHALAISVGLIPVTSKKLTLCLCSACADNFYGSGAYFLRRVNPASNEKELCTYCSQRMGVEYEITKRKGR